MKRYSTNIRQQQIVKAALEIIADAGQEGLTMRRIAENVGVSDAAIYKHFHSKKDILVTMIHSIRQELIGEIRNRNWDSDNPINQLKELVRYFYRYLKQHHGVPHVLFSGAMFKQDTAYTQSIREILEQTLALFRTKIHAAQRSGSIQKDIDPDIIALIILGHIQSEITLWRLREDSPPLGNGFDEFWYALQRGIGFFNKGNVS